MSPADMDDAGGRKRALGRGLNALFGDDEAEMAVSGGDMHSGVNAVSDASISTPGRRVISVGQLIPGAFQPRHLFNDESLEELATSIAQHGLLQPILVRPHPTLPGNYEIVAGERRWRAAQKAQLHEVPVVIRELDDTTTLEIALIENLQREDLNAVDEARALKQLVNQFDYTAEQVAEKLGKSRSYVANMLRLTDLSEPVLSLVADGKLSAGHARALIPLAKDQQIDEAKKIIALGLNVRQTEKMISEVQGRDIKHRTDKIARKIAAGEAEDKDLNTLALEREVSNILGMKVSIDMVNAQEGQMTIAFRSLDQLDEVLHRLSHNPGRLAIKG